MIVAEHRVIECGFRGGASAICPEDDLQDHFTDQLLSYLDPVTSQLINGAASFPPMGGLARASQRVVSEVYKLEH